MKVDGGCHCGRVTYEAEVDPSTASICHCTDCQVLSGSAYRFTVAAKKDGFRLTGAAPKIYLKTGDSGAKRVQAFCSECGSPIYSSAVDDPQVFNIRAGTVRQRGALRPTVQIWCRSALDWVLHPEATPMHDKKPA